MHFLALALAVFPVAALAALNGRCTGDLATGAWRTDGICITTSNCSGRGGKTKNGACPSDPENVKCCIIDEDKNPCGQWSYCTWTSNTCFSGGTRRSSGFIHLPGVM